MAGELPSVVIIGAGIVGLATGLLLSEAGHKVSIIARDLPGDQTAIYTSAWAAALLAAHPDGDQEMQRRSLAHYKRLWEREPFAGFQLITIEEYYDDREDESSIWYQDLFEDFDILPRDELPMSAKIGMRYKGHILNPVFFLPWLCTELTRKGVTFLRKEVESLEEARTLVDAQIIVNASGVGAAKLANDEHVFPARGQTMFVKSNYDRATIFQGSSYTYAIPRTYSGGVILGGVKQADAMNETVDPATRVDILRRVNELTRGAFEWVDLEKDVVQDIVGFRPCRKGGMCVEREGDVIHAYGGGELGYVYAFGMAEIVTEFARKW